jgi:hypothetical protein
VYTVEMAAAENDYHSRGLIAIVVCGDPCYNLTWEMVKEAKGWWLGVPHARHQHGFFSHRRVFCCCSLCQASKTESLVGQARIQLLPWTRLIGVEASKLPFKVRLCIEGIPHHARQVATIR